MDARYEKALKLIIEELVEEMGQSEAYVYCSRPGNRAIIQDMAKSRGALLPFRDLPTGKEQKVKKSRRRKQKVVEAVTA